MGAKGRNFYHNLAQRYGYEKEAALIQDLYLDGKKKEAEAAVPADLLRATALVGPAGQVRERLAAYAEAGATTLTVTPLAPDHRSRLALVEQLRAWTS
jgi:alkanesulfonate monooxygenase SsuD/methylene tetrahydromethanopterin reductase-like flavin-dependent oxidoreductase (luciferase family)